MNLLYIKTTKTECRKKLYQQRRKVSSDLSFYLNELKKEVQIKLKSERMWQIIKQKAEIRKRKQDKKAGN